MKTLSAAVALIALLASAFAISGAAAPAPDEEMLASIEHDFAEMQITKDPATITRIAAVMDERFRFTDPSAPDSGASKEQLLGLIRSDKLVVQALDFLPFAIRIFGSTAIVEGVNSSRGTFAGRDISGTFVWMDVFEKRDGHWVWLFSQSGKIGDRLSDKDPCGQPPCPARHAGFSLKR
ncbi:MAG: hypothetical protein JWP35_3045 [Caulobacter sp.]|nr:hypothetical protein [Caulobacter sp.]